MSRRLALIIGNSAYRDNTLARLLTPDIDVGALAEILLDPEVGAFDDTKVLVNMTSATVRREIADFFTQKSREDLLLLYFSGHGVLDDRGRLHLAVKDTDHSLLRGTAVAASFIADEMDNSRSQRQVLILDCCHSGAFARGTKGSPGATVGTASAFEGTGFGRVVLTATDATQYAWEGDRIIGEAESSLFTHYMVQGLQSGEADINGDGQITIDELYDYVYAQVVKQTPRQTPGKWSFKEQGEIIIARAGRPEGVRPIIETRPFIDVELQQKLERLYTKGLSAYWLEEWEQAAHNFQLILEISPDYQDADEKFAEVTRQLKLKNLYDQALAAFDTQQFREAVTALETLVTEAPDYKDAAPKLQSARKQGQVADLYMQAKQLHQAGQWQAVIHIFGRIAELAPDFVDPEELLSTARQEFERQKRLAEIQGRYQQALGAMNSGRWQEARNGFAQIQEQEPGFEETERLLARVEAEIAKQEAQRQVQERVEILHEQAINLFHARQWRQALDKMKEIETLDPDFADPDEIAAKAEAEIAREEGEAQRQNELAALYAEAVRLLRAGQYQEALEKWDEVQAINSDYLDRHEVQATARKKLAVRSQPAILRFRRSTWAKVLLGGVILAGIVAGIFISNSGPFSEVVFSSNRDGDWEIYKMRSDGTGLSKLTNNSADDGQPSTSMIGQVVFVSNRDDNHEIYVMNSDGSQQTRLTKNGSTDFMPAWSPDGKRIAFISNGRAGDGDGGEIYIMNADGNQQTNLTNHEANDFDPAWSPDGKQIAFVSNREERHKIFVVDVDGKNLHPLIDQPFEQFVPCWSLDGRVTFGTPQDKAYIVQKDGKGLEDFVDFRDACWSRWSPDRRWIVFADIMGPIDNWEIYLRDQKTGQVKNLTNDPMEDNSPSWLP